MPSIHDGEHLCGITLIRGFYVNQNDHLMSRILITSEKNSHLDQDSPVDRLVGLVVIAPAGRAEDPGSNPGPGENFFLNLLMYISSDGHSES